MSLGFTFNAYVKNSLVLTQEQFNTVIAAIGEGLIPVPHWQLRPPLLPKNPVEDMDDLLFESKFRFSKPELEQLVALMVLPVLEVLEIVACLLNSAILSDISEAFQDYFPIEI